MVGLSILLESTQKEKGSSSVIMMRRNSQVIINNLIPPITPGPGFLDYCSLCRRKLFPANDIYMYKGDRAFCSEECRCRQILMDEERDDVIDPRSRLKESCGFSAAATSSSGRKNRGGANGGSGY